MNRAGAAKFDEQNRDGRGSIAFKSVYGVDFSGAKLAGEHIWIACLRPRCGRHELLELSWLRVLCGCSKREPALAHLVKMVASSESALWGMDFPFGLPIEVVEPGWRWDDQLRWIGSFAHGAYSLGEECVRRARARGREIHIRRDTDRETKTPFDCYHYRIIYQTFHGMRDVLLPLSRTKGTAILPFQYRRLPSAKRVIVESCPGSTLKRIGLPHQNYKQPQGGPLTPVRRRTRHRILEGLSEHIDIPRSAERVMMRNQGGDAIDAVIAALGAIQGWVNADHRAIGKHPRYPLEGRLYV
ncbi:MAG TPA: hypothetical protein VN541_01220 [Tepidisphaeraceae bacterium]|nr:hypothetical protein [Tepidisphaeraceae bacterium]